MTATDHFSIQPERITALSRDFTESQQQLDARTSSFAARAENVNDAFGVMAESTDALTKYVMMTRSTVGALQQLTAMLGNYSTGLQQTVANYQAADQAHAQQFGARP